MLEESRKNEFATRPSSRTVLAEVKFAPITVIIPWGTVTSARDGDIRVKTGAEGELPPPPPPPEPPPPVPPPEFVEAPPFVPRPELSSPPPQPVKTIAAQMIIDIAAHRDPI